MDSGVFPYQHDATIVGADSDPDPERTVVGKPSTLYFSRDEPGDRHERTVIWSEKEQIDLSRAAAKFASYGEKMGVRGRIFASIGIATVLIVGIIGAVFKENRVEDKFVGPSVQMPPQARILASSTPASTVVRKPSGAESAPAVDSKMAADALIEGRLDQAIAYFRALKNRYPENASYGLIVDILTASQGVGAP